MALLKRFNLETLSGKNRQPANGKICGQGRNDFHFFFLMYKSKMGKQYFKIQCYDIVIEINLGVFGGPHIEVLRAPNGVPEIEPVLSLMQGKHPTPVLSFQLDKNIYKVI